MKPAVLVAIFCSIGFAAVGPGEAFAQVNTLETDNPRENARLRLGPLYATPEIELRELGFDTNVFNASTGETRDFTFTLTPRAQTWLPFARRALLKTTLGLDLVWYQREDTERSVDPALTTRGEVYLRRITLFGDYAILSSRARPNFEIDQRSRRDEQAGGAGVDVRLTPKMSVEIRGTRSTVTFDGDADFLGTPLHTTLDRTSAGFATAARLRLTPLTTITLRGERFEDRFPLAAARSSDNVRVTAGFELRPRALISGSAFVGFRHLNPVDEARLPEFKGIVSDVSLVYTLLGATSFRLRQSRDINYSFEPLQPYYVDNGLGLHVRRALGPRFDLVATVDRHRYRYRDFLGDASSSSSATIAAGDRVDVTWNTGASFGYRLGREARVGFGVSYWHRDSSTRSFRNYDGLRIGTTATYGF